MEDSGALDGVTRTAAALAVEERETDTKCENEDDDEASVSVDGSDAGEEGRPAGPFRGLWDARDWVTKAEDEAEGGNEGLGCPNDLTGREEGGRESKGRGFDDGDTTGARRSTPLGRDCDDAPRTDLKARTGLENGVPNEEAVLNGGLESTLLVVLADDGPKALGGVTDAL